MNRRQLPAFVLTLLLFATPALPVAAEDGGAVNENEKAPITVTQTALENDSGNNVLNDRETPESEAPTAAPVATEDKTDSVSDVPSVNDVTEPPQEATTIDSTTQDGVTMTGGEAAGNVIVHNGISGVSVSFEMSKDIIGYRLYRSEDPEELGRSCSDFFITSGQYVDTTIEPQTTYYYTLKEVIAEAKPLENKTEKLGKTLATWSVVTKAEVNQDSDEGAVNRFIMLKVDDPMMSINGKVQEVDPGRGTVPMIRDNRTLVPIRAITEAMGGSAEWIAERQEIVLKANDKNVKMWIGNTDILVGEEKGEMDVAPLIENGRTYVPLRFATENLNCKVEWIDTSKEIVIVWQTT